MDQTRKTREHNGGGRGAYITGWIAVGISILVATLWAIWGTLEAAHEGWWAPQYAGRLLQALMYLTPMIFCIMLGLLAVRWPKFGAVFYFLIGSWFTFMTFWERRDNLTAEVVLSWLPVTGLVICVGILYWFAKIGRPKLAYMLVLAIPLATSLACSIEPIWRISHRPQTRNLDATLVEGSNGKSLVWAPAGPGWARTPKECLRWDLAMERVRYITEDGLAVSGEVQDIWRLPTVEELVVSQTRMGSNAGGEWDATAGKPSYSIQPDKEAPLWDIYSETIYYWTSTEVDSDRAWIIDHHGAAWSKLKSRSMGSQGFRAVKDP